MDPQPLSKTCVNGFAGGGQSIRGTLSITLFYGSFENQEKTSIVSIHQFDLVMSLLTMN